MDKNYRKIISCAFQAVLETLSGAEAIEKSISEGESVPQDIMVMIGIEGDVDGHAYMSVSAQVGKEIASRMLGDLSEFDNADEIVTSAVSELCNMVMGNACTNISVQDARVEIRPPVIVPEHEKSHTKNMFSIRINLDSIGNAHLDVSLKDAASA